MRKDTAGTGLSATTILKAESASMDGGNVKLTTKSFPAFSGL
jgi:hypothetical protein